MTVFLEVSFLNRLLLAGFLGSIIGLEREWRMKEAGLRTHFLVAIGSALMMLISQYGFSDMVLSAGLKDADPARIAAQIVSGIGFIGAGSIMVQRKYVHGLTTAAGLWVVAGIGMAAGCGRFILAGGTTVLALIGLESFRLIVRFVRLTDWDIIFTVKKYDDIGEVIHRLLASKAIVKRYKIQRNGSSGYRVAMGIRIRSKNDFGRELLNAIEFSGDVKLESIE